MRNPPRFVVSRISIVGRWDWNIRMRCIVCNLDIKGGQEISRCPHCGNLSHRVHILEWLHTRNYCPACKEHLSESELEKFLPEEEVKGKCPICGLEIKTGQQAARCPHCGNLSHRAHLFQWLQYRDECPACHEHLTESEIEKTAS
nr:hypothetical protein [Candidatus Njordarchaeum guaymaensis]